jgi:hypothetical protein
VSLPVDVIVSDAGLQLLARATRTIPIVAVMADPMVVWACRRAVDHDNR